MSLRYETQQLLALSSTDGPVESVVADVKAGAVAPASDVEALRGQRGSCWQQQLQMVVLSVSWQPWGVGQLLQDPMCRGRWSSFHGSRWLLCENRRGSSEQIYTCYLCRRGMVSLNLSGRH